jgi:hypothetical protein
VLLNLFSRLRVGAVVHDVATTVGGLLIRLERRLERRLRVTALGRRPRSVLSEGPVVRAPLPPAPIGTPLVHLSRAGGLFGRLFCGRRSRGDAHSIREHPAQGSVATGVRVLDQVASLSPFILRATVESPGEFLVPLCNLMLQMGRLLEFPGHGRIGGSHVTGSMNAASDHGVARSGDSGNAFC